MWLVGRVDEAPASFLAACPGCQRLQGVGPPLWWGLFILLVVLSVPPATLCAPLGQVVGVVRGQVGGFRIRPVFRTWLCRWAAGSPRLVTAFSELYLLLWETEATHWQVVAALNKSTCCGLRQVAQGMSGAVL